MEQVGAVPGAVGGDVVEPGACVEEEDRAVRARYLVQELLGRRVPAGAGAAGEHQYAFLPQAFQGLAVVGARHVEGGDGLQGRPVEAAGTDAGCGRGVVDVRVLVAADDVAARAGPVHAVAADVDPAAAVAEERLGVLDRCLGGRRRAGRVLPGPVRVGPARVGPALTGPFRALPFRARPFRLGPARGGAARRGLRGRGRGRDAWLLHGSHPRP
ncbi:hypothetical protein [Streptomyces thermolineatus]|uniref:hypothetical protein n=1 Tax=Streptomyces thermolineatus TaxID=44033 RepID=UPI00384C208D